MEVFIRVTWLSDLNSTGSLSFLLPMPSELKHTLAKMLTLLTRISICCLEGLWLACLQQRWSLLSPMQVLHNTYSEQERGKADRTQIVPLLSKQWLQHWTTQDPNLWSSAQQFYNLELEYLPMHYNTKWLMSAAWFSLSYPHPHTHVQTAWLRKENKPANTVCLKPEREKNLGTSWSMTRVYGLTKKTLWLHSLITFCTLLLGCKTFLKVRQNSRLFLPWEI